MSKARRPQSRPLSLSEARARLSPLVAQVERAPTRAIPIAVRGAVKAYLVSAEHPGLQQAEREVSAHRESLFGCAPVKGNAQSLDALLERAKSDQERLTLQEWRELNRDA